MTDASAMPSARVAELRAAFDAAFSQAPPTERIQTDDVLAIRVAGGPYALRLREMSGLLADKELTKLPALLPTLLGLSSFRGMIISVYDLAGLLGSNTGGSRRWLALTAADATIGLAFDQLEGYLRVPRDAIAIEAHSALRSSPTREVLRIGAVARLIVSLPAVVEEIKARVHHETVQKER